MALPGIFDAIGAKSLFTGLTSLIGGAARNVSQEQQAVNQQQFQERMSSTAYQRAMQDMREAGLNPMLAAKVGPASTPLGAMANIQDIGTPAAQAATSAYQAETQRRQQESQAVKFSAEIEKLTSDISVNEATKERISTDVALLAQRRLTEVQQTKLVKETALKMVQSVGIEKATKILKEMEAKAYQYIDEEYVNPYIAKLFLDYSVDVLREARNLFSLRKRKSTKTTTYKPGERIETTE